MSFQVRIGGVFLSTIAPWGGLSWSHAADGGCKEASWSMYVPPTFSHPLLKRGAVVHVLAGSWTVWRGYLSEPDYTSTDEGVTFTARGLSSLGSGFVCLDGSGNTTTTPDVAVDRAVANGLPWARRASLSNVPYASQDATDGLTKLSTLLDEWATASGLRWGVGASGAVYATADPTVPTWHMTPGAGRFGLADDDYASDLYIRYVNTSGGYATTTVGDAAARSAFGRREEGVDVTGLGPVTEAKAQTVGQGMLAKGKARQAWANDVTPSQWQLTTPGGTPAYLPFVRAHQMVRMHGVRDEQGRTLPYVDWVIGETSYEAGATTIGLSPTGLAARNLVDVLTVLGGA